MPPSANSSKMPGFPVENARRKGPESTRVPHPVKESARRLIRLFAWPRDVLFWNKCMIVYERVFAGRAGKHDWIGAPPLSRDFLMKAVFSNREADELEAEGFEFRNRLPPARQRLDAGAIAFCVFHAFEFANCGWVALDRKAQLSLPEPHIRVNFAHNESFTGGTFTNPKYRGMGLMSHSLMERCRFLEQRGIRKDRSSALKENLASRKAALKAGYAIRGQVGFKNRLCGRTWREWPWPEPTPKGGR